MYGRRMPRWLSLASFLGVFLVVGWAFVISTALDRSVAIELLERGQRVTATDVHIRTTCSARGCGAADVLVTLDGRTYTLRGTNADQNGLPEQSFLAPPSGHDYAPPLDVVLSTGTGRAMAMRDVAVVTDPDLLPSATAVAVAATVLATVVVWLAWRLDRREPDPTGRHRHASARRKDR